MHFVSIEGDSGSTPGVATGVITFASPGPVLGSNGLLVVTATTPCGSRTFPAATTVATTSLLDTAGGALQNGTNSFLFISSTTPIVAGTDYDTDNNGTLESLPAGATVVDGVAWTDGGAGDITYGGVVLSATGGTIGAATRFPGNTTANSAASWYAGAMTGTNDSNTYSATIRSANFPSDGVLTPGAPNVGTPVAPQNHVDFNGDGKTDFAVVRNVGGGATGQVRWFININGTATTYGSDWGIATDFFVPEDFDGDGKTDIAIWRAGAPTVAAFYILESQANTVRIQPFGQSGDEPRVVEDYDGDGKADVSVYRAGAASGEQSFWFFRGSLNNPGGNTTYVPWGLNGDFPAPGDYDGDGKSDFVIQRNNGGGQARFWMLQTTAGFDSVVYGTPTDVIVPGDYDADGKTDLAVVRGIGGQYNWFVRPSSTGVISAAPIAVFGASATDFPVHGDYDGDGKTDPAIWRPSATAGASAFWVMGSTGSVFSVPFGQNGDYPVANYNRF